SPSMFPPGRGGEASFSWRAPDCSARLLCECDRLVEDPDRLGLRAVDRAPALDRAAADRGTNPVRRVEERLVRGRVRDVRFDQEREHRVRATRVVRSIARNEATAAIQLCASGLQNGERAHVALPASAVVRLSSAGWTGCASPGGRIAAWV